MKFIVRYSTPWGNYITAGIEAICLENFTEIKLKIELKFGLKPQFQLLKYKRDGYTIRIVESFPFSIYEIKENSIIYVEQIENKEDLLNLQNFKGSNISNKYYNRLGFQTKIEDEIDPKNNNDNLKMMFSTFSTPINQKVFNSPKRANNSEDDSKPFNVKKYIDNEIENLLKETKSGNLKEITNILTRLPNNISSTVKEEILKKKSGLFNEKGVQGWNAVHFAVFYGNFEILKLFVEKSADLNKETDEGWTPLMLAIHKNHKPIVKYMLLLSDIEINKLTSKGTALHLSCYNNKGTFVSWLLNKNADPSNLNNEGYIPSDLSTNEEIINMINKANSSISSENSHKNEEDNNNENYQPIIVGELFKIGDSYITLYARYFVLHSENGTLIRYRSKSDCPNRPSEIIPLRDIIYIKKIPCSWYMRSNIHYFEINYSKRLILGAYHKSTINLWIKHIYDASIYYKNLEDKLNNLNLEQNLHFLGNINKRSVDAEKKIIEIQDILRDKKELISDDKLRAILNASSNIRERIWSSQEIKSPDVFKHSNIKFKEEKQKNPDDIELKCEEESDEHINFKSFQILKIIGSGAFGKIFLVKKKNNGRIFAMKALKKKELILKRQLIYAVTEANVLKKTNHPFIVQLFYSFQTPTYLYLIMDYCSGGDLSLQLAKNGNFTEDVTRFYIAELILAIEYLHDLNIIYRDLKPENILLDRDGHLKLADFGLAKENVGFKDFAKSFCGSPAYLPPEIILNKGSTRASDIYGIGAVMYECLTGNPPYYNYDMMTMYKAIEEGKLTFPENISERAKNLLKKLLNKDPTQRIGVLDKNEIKNDEFFKGLDWETVEKKNYEPPLLSYEIEDELSPFERHFHHEDLDYEIQNRKVNRVIKFTFVKKEEKKEFY